MIHKILFSPSNARQRGLTPPERALHGLGKMVVLAGPNGAGKSRYLETLQHTIQFARVGATGGQAWTQNIGAWRSGLANLEANYNDATVREKVRAEIIAALQQTQASLDEYVLLEKNLEVTGSLEQTPTAVLTYQLHRGIPLAQNLTPANAQQLVRDSSGIGFHGAHSSISAYFRCVAKALWNATNSQAKDHPSVGPNLNDATSFNKTLDALVGGYVEPSLDENGEVIAKFRERVFEYGELSNGEAVLVTWAIILHRQQRPLSDAIILIDEPENHLHPDACIKALTALRDKVLGPNGQIWLATHSVQLVAFANMDSVWMVDGGRIEYAGNKVDLVIDRLLGGSEGRDRLRSFLADADGLGFYKFAAECLIDPTVVASSQSDPQEAQFVRVVRDRSGRGEPLRMLDYGAGKGRLATALREARAGRDPELPKPADLNYYAYNGHRAGGPETDECRRRVAELAESEGVRADYVDDVRRFQLSAEPKMDLVVLCNVLHEIPVDRWQETFGEIASILRDDGTLLVMEDQNMGVGELPTAHGFIVLDRYELAELFGATSEQVRELPRAHNGRLTQIEVPRSLLGNISPTQIAGSLKLVQARALREVTELRRGNDPSFRAGRLHAYFSMLHMNATLAGSVYSSPTLIRM